MCESLFLPRCICSQQQTTASAHCCSSRPKGESLLLHYSILPPFFPQLGGGAIRVNFTLTRCQARTCEIQSFDWPRFFRFLLASSLRLLFTSFHFFLFCSCEFFLSSSLTHSLTHSLSSFPLRTSCVSKGYHFY